MSTKYTGPDLQIPRILNNYYWIRQDQGYDWNLIKKALTMIPKNIMTEKKQQLARKSTMTTTTTKPTNSTNTSVSSLIDSFTLYEEKKDDLSTWLGVPRFWGEQNLGSPQTSQLTLGEAMSDQVTFLWTLKDTPQQPQVAAAQAWLQNQGQGLIALPTGAGKTALGLYLAVQQKRKTLILVHNDDLAHQWFDRIKTSCSAETRVGFIQGQKCEVDQRDFVIGMIQTLSSETRSFDLSSFGMVIVDECHHIAARTFSRAMRRTCTQYVLGISATPHRKDGLTDCLHWLLGPLVFKATRQDIKPQIITQIVYHDGNQKPIKSMAGMTLMVNRLVRDSKRNKLVEICLKKMITLPEVRKIMVFSDRNDHLISMYQHFLGHATLPALMQQHNKPFELGLLISADWQEPPKPSTITTATTTSNVSLTSASSNSSNVNHPEPIPIVEPEPEPEPEPESKTSTKKSKKRKGTTLTKKQQKRLRLDQAKTKCIIFASYRLAQEGLDIDGVNGIILATPYGNTEQVIGRAREKCVKNEQGENEYIQRVVYDIVDPFDLFEGMAWKRHGVYKKLGYITQRIDQKTFEQL
jgi:superfamily II DNA or RNA helicase